MIFCWLYIDSIYINKFRRKINKKNKLLNNIFGYIVVKERMGKQTSVLLAPLRINREQIYIKHKYNLKRLSSKSPGSNYVYSK